MSVRSRSLLTACFMVVVSILGCVSMIYAAPASALEFQTEKEWSEEGKTIDFEVEGVLVVCEKELATGVTPVTGSSLSVSMQPKYSGCKQGKNAATVETHKCLYEESGLQEPIKNLFKTETKITSCSEGIKITIAALCKILIPEQVLGRGIEAKNTKEVAPLGGEAKGEFPEIKAKEEGLCEKNVENPRRALRIITRILLRLADR